MTLQQLKYVVAVADTRNITEAARRVFISQPSLTAAIQDLENEMNLVIFNRTNKGVTITNEGDEFLSYARQVLEQAALLEDRYKGNVGGNTIFSVSCQHYSFAVNAFVDAAEQIDDLTMLCLKYKCRHKKMSTRRSTNAGGFIFCCCGQRRDGERF